MKIPAIAATCLALACGSFGAPDPAPLLARIDVPAPVSTFPLPVRAQLCDAAGRHYLLLTAAPADLQASGRDFLVLDSDAAPAAYILAYGFRAGARAAAAASGAFHIVHDDGRRLVIRSATPAADIDALARLGFQCRRLPDPPLELFAAPPAPAAALPRAAVVSNAAVAAMIAQIRQTNLYASLADLTGVQPAIAGGSYTNIRSRHQNSTAALRRATDLAYEHFLALGLQPAFQSWSAGGYSNRNVIGSLPGSVATAGIVIVCAHIDDMPSGANAPGADDNASGSAAVLAAAEALRKYSFERTLRFVIFTGEEQGLYGSDAYAAAVKAAGETNLLVLNLDMLAWDGNGDKALHLYVRPGNAAETDLAATFTNVVRVYGLQSGLVPEIVAEASDWSDHYSFTSRGLPAVCAIEEDVVDFNPYYHTTNDTLARLNLPYYTWVVKAVVGTAAHLARPVAPRPFDSLRIANGAFLAATNVGAGVFVARHETGAAESSDAFDAAWSAMASNPSPAWLKIHSEPYATALAVDARPASSETVFRGILSVVKTSAGPLTCTNRLFFDFTAAPETNCTYLVKVTVHSNATPGRVAFECITNLAAIVANGGFLNLPGLAAVSNGTAYGTCEIARRFVAQASSNLVLRMPAFAAGSVTLALPGQPGVRVVDAVEYTTNLFPAAPWLPLATVTSLPPPDAAGFETGWTSVDQVLDTSGAPAATRYFRVRRQWPPP